MKYLIMMFGDQATMMETRSTEWIRSMIGFMKDLDHELRDAGEYVDGQGSSTRRRPRRSASRAVPRS